MQNRDKQDSMDKPWICSSSPHLWQPMRLRHHCNIVNLGKAQGQQHSKSRSTPYRIRGKYWHIIIMFWGKHAQHVGRASRVWWRTRVVYTTSVWILCSQWGHTWSSGAIYRQLEDVVVHSQHQTTLPPSDNIHSQHPRTLTRSNNSTTLSQHPTRLMWWQISPVKTSDLLRDKCVYQDKTSKENLLVSWAFLILAY